jgi:hypothetical protein
LEVGPAVIGAEARHCALADDAEHGKVEGHLSGLFDRELEGDGDRAGYMAVKAEGNFPETDA